MSQHLTELFNKDGILPYRVAETDSFGTVTATSYWTFNGRPCSPFRAFAQTDTYRKSENGVGWAPNDGASSLNTNLTMMFTTPQTFSNAMLFMMSYQKATGEYTATLQYTTDNGSTWVDIDDIVIQQTFNECGNPHYISFNKVENANGVRLIFNKSHTTNLNSINNYQIKIFNIQLYK